MCNTLDFTAISTNNDASVVQAETINDYCLLIKIVNNNVQQPSAALVVNMISNLVFQFSLNSV